MKTFTLYFPNKLRAKLIIEVFEDETIYSCIKLNEETGKWESFAEGLLNPDIRAAINADVAALRWQSEPKDIFTEIFH